MSSSVHINQGTYDRWSSFYDSYPNSTVAMDDAHFPELWSHITRGKVLEIGCGTGRHTQRLVAQGNYVVGVDLSRGMLEAARSKLPAESVQLIEADFMKYQELRPECFDAAICSLVIEHIADIRGFFLKVAGLLKPGGEFFLSEIHPSRTSKGSQAHFEDPATGVEVRTVSYPHTEADFQEAAALAGFRLIHNRDIVADDRLTALNSEWARYLGSPMIKIFAFRK